MYSALGCSILIDFSILGYFCQLEFIHPSDIAICSIGGSRHSFDCKAITLSNRIRSVIGCRFEHTSRVDRIATRHRRNKQLWRSVTFQTSGPTDWRTGGRAAHLCPISGCLAHFPHRTGTPPPLIPARPRAPDPTRLRPSARSASAPQPASRSNCKSFHPIPAGIIRGEDSTRTRTETLAAFPGINCVFPWCEQPHTLV